MSKELPYFRFVVSEWMNDDISLESYLIKGVFIDVCAYYWFRDCSITKAKLEQRFSNALAELKALYNSGIIKEKTGFENIEILFLNEQYDQLSSLRKNRQNAGRKGGKQSLSKGQAKLKQRPSYKDKDNNKDNINIPFFEFWNMYAKKEGSKNGCEKKWNIYVLPYLHR